MEEVFVFYAPVPPAVEREAVLPEAREREILSCRHEGLRLQKYCVWKLLDAGLRFAFGFGVAEAELSRAENGQWISPRCFLSLSHCKTAVAVALSRTPVGADIERTDDARFTPRLTEKILTREERARGMGENPAALWTKKESVFKLCGTGAFIPSTVDARGARTYFVTINGEEYALSIAGDTKGVKLYAADFDGGKYSII